MNAARNEDPLAMEAYDPLAMEAYPPHCVSGDQYARLRALYRTCSDTLLEQWMSYVWLFYGCLAVALRGLKA